MHYKAKLKLYNEVEITNVNEKGKKSKVGTIVFNDDGEISFFRTGRTIYNKKGYLTEGDHVLNYAELFNLVMSKKKKKKEDTFEVI